MQMLLAHAAQDVHIHEETSLALYVIGVAILFGAGYVFARFTAKTRR